MRKVTRWEMMNEIMRAAMKWLMKGTMKGRLREMMWVMAWEMVFFLRLAFVWAPMVEEVAIFLTDGDGDADNIKPVAQLRL